jgi:hypothetical protein
MVDPISTGVTAAQAVQLFARALARAGLTRTESKRLFDALEKDMRDVVGFDPAALNSLFSQPEFHRVLLSMLRFGSFGEQEAANLCRQFVHSTDPGVSDDALVRRLLEAVRRLATVGAASDRDAIRITHASLLSEFRALRDVQEPIKQDDELARQVARPQIVLLDSAILSGEPDVLALLRQAALTSPSEVAEITRAISTNGLDSVIKAARDPGSWVYTGTARLQELVGLSLSRAGAASEAEKVFAALAGRTDGMKHLGSSPGRRAWLMR